MSDAVTELRLALRANGYSPIPVLGKEPLVVGWQTKSGASEAEITGWTNQYRKLTNTGILTRNTASADVDIPLQDVADAVEDVMRDWFDGRGPLLCRFGNAPKRALLFRVSTPFPKLVAKFVAPNRSKHKIEFLCDGQQLVVDGIHPDTGRPYRWARDQSPLTTPRSELPEIDEQEARELLAYIAQMLKEQFGFEPDTDTDTNGGEGADIAVAGNPIEALATLDPTDGEQVNATYCRVIPELLKGGEHPNDVLKQVVDAAMAAADHAGLAWSRPQEIKRVVATMLSQYRNMSILLRDYDPATGAIPDCLPGEFHAPWIKALENGRRPDIGFNRGGFYVRAWTISGARHNAGTDAPSAEHMPSKADGGSDGTADPKQEKRTRGTFVLHPFVPFDPMSLPPRQWLYGKHYQRRTVSATIAPGGVGKSSLDLVEAIAMATCRNLLGEQPEERLRVWYHNGEDNLDEIRRRICAICQHYGIPQTELQGWLWVTTGSEFPLRVAQGYSNLVINETLVRQISAAIADNAIDVAVLDPLVTLHSVSEQDNNKMDAIIRIFFGIADAHDCAFELAHHTRKLPPGSTADYTMDDGRGASATGDALRAARVLNRMSPKDAEDAGVGEVERLSRFRVDRAKGNYSAPAAATTWRQFLSVTLPNGDEVGVVAPWDFPGQGVDTPKKAAADRKAEEVFLQLLDKFTARGVNVNAGAGPNYAPARFAGEREVKAAKLGKAALKEAMNRLLDSGRVRTEEDPAKRNRRRLVPWQGETQ